MGEKRSYSAISDTHGPMSTDASSLQGSDAGRQNSSYPRKQAALEDPKMSQQQQQQQATSPYVAMFENFRAELDEHHDRRERIIKASRDITAASKKIIFALQRVRALGQPIPSSISKTTSVHGSTIAGLYTSIRSEFKGINVYRYAQQISPGIQEHVEALLFQRYLETQQIMAYEEMRKLLAALPSSLSSNLSHSPEMSTEGARSGTKTKTDAKESMRDVITEEQMDEEEVKEGGERGKLVLTPEDYILGLLDMTGEVMRFAISSIATTGTLPSSSSSSSSSSRANSKGSTDADTSTNPGADADADKDRESVQGDSGGAREGEERKRTVLADLQTLRQHLSILSYTVPWQGNDARFVKDLRGKMEVMLTSVDKVERALYGLVVRGSERPKGWIPDLSSASHSSGGGAAAAAAVVDVGGEGGEGF